MSIRRAVLAFLAGALALAGVVALVRPDVLRAQVGPEQQGAETVATVGDRSFTLDEVDRLWGEKDPAARAQARQELYDGRRQILDEAIGDYLIEREAQARGLTVPKLLEAELPKRITPITDEGIAQFYRDLGGQTNGATIEQLTPSIRRFLEQRQPVVARQALVEELQQKSRGLRILLEPPRFTVTTAESDPTLGPAAAPIQIVEFSDFECPFCGRAEPTLLQLKTAYGDRIHLVFKDFPLPSHPNAFPAAEAAQCARAQGKFWEYHDQLFANQKALGRDDLKRYAVAIGLNPAAFNTCVDEGTMKALVQGDMDESQRYGVSSTPTFFINGRMVSGAQPYDVFDRIVREELARATK